MERFYYKNKSNTGFLNLKSPLIDDNYIQITKEEFEDLSKLNSRELMVKEKAAQEKIKQISTLKKKLADTDYIVLKIAEALAENDTATVTLLKTTYSTELAARKSWRDEINRIEQ